MCIIAAKYFDNIGWVGVKNRDRNYVPEITFEIDKSQQPYRLIMRDDMTGYMEGLNIKGVCVLSASLQVMDDEKEIKKRTSDDNPDGERIKQSLLCDNSTQATKLLIQLKITGNTIVFDRDHCYLIEGCNRNDKYEYVCKEISHNDYVARTNHGIYLPWAGYQYNVDDKQDKSRQSSESRLKQALSILQKAKQPVDIIDGLTLTPNTDTQLNALRTTTDSKKMRTTLQEMMIPTEHTFFVRPVQSKLDIDFWKINQDKADLWVEILSNRLLNHPNKTMDDNEYIKTYSKYKDIL
jgi:hypothetical protein